MSTITVKGMDGMLRTLQALIAMREERGEKVGCIVLPHDFHVPGMTQLFGYPVVYGGDEIVVGRTYAS